MESQKYLEEMKKIQDLLIDFIDNDSMTDENFKNFVDQLNKHLICQDHHKLKDFLGILMNISNNHHRCANFFVKIEQILHYFKKEISNFFSNLELFKIFKRNKRILLYLFDEKMLTMNDYIISKIIKYKYHLYFAPELRPHIESVKNATRLFFNDTTVKDINEELPYHFYEYRKRGENEKYICELIRNDSVEEFITYVNKNNYSLESTIELSLYETNYSLLNNKINVSKKEPTLIEYAAFFGSIQIFQFLLISKAEINPYIWDYAIYGQNAEIIHILEENNIYPFFGGYKNCFQEAIVCHHNNIASYILDNYMPEESEFCSDIFILALNTYNFAFIENDLINETALFELCKHDYYHLVDFILKDEDTDKNLIKTLDKGAFYLAVKKGNIELIKLLMTNDCIDVNFEFKGRTALHLAIEKGNVEIVKLLLKNERIDINAPYKPNEREVGSALYLAVEKENIEIVELLLANDKLDVNFPNFYEGGNVTDEKTALYLAVDKENFEIVKLLMANDNIDANYPYIHKSEDIMEEISALYLAVDKENIEIVELLLANDNIDVNTLYTVTNVCGNSHNRRNMAKYVNNNQKIKEKSVLYSAVEKENVEIIELLLANKDLNINYINISMIAYICKI